MRLSMTHVALLGANGVEEVAQQLVRVLLPELRTGHATGARAEAVHARRGTGRTCGR